MRFIFATLVSMPSRAAHPSNLLDPLRRLREPFQCPLGRLTLRTFFRRRTARGRSPFQCPLGRLTLRTRADRRRNPLHKFQCPLGRLTLRTCQQDLRGDLPFVVSMPSRAAHPSNSLINQSGTVYTTVSMPSRAAHPSNNAEQVLECWRWMFQCPLGRLTLRTTDSALEGSRRPRFNALSGGSPFEHQRMRRLRSAWMFQCPLGRLTLRTGNTSDAVAGWTVSMPSRAAHPSNPEARAQPAIPVQFQCPLGRLTLRTLAAMLARSRLTRFNALSGGSPFEQFLCGLPANAASCFNALSGGSPFERSPSGRRPPDRQFQCPLGRLTLRTTGKTKASAEDHVSMPSRAAHPFEPRLRRHALGGYYCSMPSRAAHPSNQQGLPRTSLPSRFNALSGGSPFEQSAQHSSSSTIVSMPSRAAHPSNWRRPRVRTRRSFNALSGGSPFERRRSVGGVYLHPAVSMPSRAAHPSNSERRLSAARRPFQCPLGRLTLRTCPEGRR